MKIPTMGLFASMLAYRNENVNPGNEKANTEAAFYFPKL